MLEMVFRSFSGRSLEEAGDLSFYHYSGKFKSSASQEEKSSYRTLLKTDLGTDNVKNPYYHVSKTYYNILISKYV